MKNCDLTIIVVAWNVKELVDECFSALRLSDDSLNKQILLVDNGSIDGTTDFVREAFPEVEVIESPVNLGFIRANNLAYRAAQGQYVLMLNSDAFVFPETIREIVDFMKRTPDSGVVGPRLVDRNGMLKPSIRHLPTPLRLFLLNLGLDGKLPFLRPINDVRTDHSAPQECGWVSGCCLLTRKDVIDDMGFFLREDFFMYNDDNDLCKRVHDAGYKTYYYPVNVVHLGGATVRKMHGKSNASMHTNVHQLESQIIYFRKNHGLGTVLANVSLLLVFTFSVMIKRIVMGRSAKEIGSLWRRIQTILRITRETAYGRTAIH